MGVKTASQVVPIKHDMSSHIGKSSKQNYVLSDNFNIKNTNNHYKLIII